MAGLELPPEAHQLFVESGKDRVKQGRILDMACLELDEEARERLLDSAGDICDACIRASYEAWTEGGFSDRLADVEARTLVIGSDDPFLPPDFLRSAVVVPIADARLSIVEGAGHYIQVERPEKTARLIEDFLSP